MKACTLCLKTNTKMYELGNSAARDFIQEIFVNNGYQKLSKDNYICLICRYQMNKSYDFIQKTLRAQKKLKEIVAKEKKMTVSTLSQIDRDKLRLDLNLLCQKTEINYHILDTRDNDEDTKINLLDNKNDAIDKCIIKKEDNVDLITTFYENEISCDDSYEEKSIEYVKEECDINVDGKPSLNEVSVTKSLRNRSYVSYKETTDFKMESRKKKTKVKPSDSQKVTKLVTKKKRNKKPNEKKKMQTDYRKFPMKCDHCTHVIHNKTEHYHHYLFYHQDIQYPYGMEGKFVCQHCGVVKGKAYTLHQHELTHGEKKISCSECGKLFHNETRLKRHQRRHGAALKICDYCNKGFVAREDLVLHIRTHTGAKPFKCALCDAAFAHRGNVAVHMRSRHTGNAPKETSRQRTR